MSDPDAPLAVWRDGALAPASPVDPGLLIGLGVFETLPVLSGRAFAVRRHLARLRAGARQCGLPVPEEELLHAAITGLERADGVPGLRSGRLRLTWTPGPAGEGALLATVGPTLPARPARVLLTRFRRNESSPLTGVKSTSYAENILALREAQRRGFTEAVFANTRGELCEGATSNVFIETDGEILTPELTSGCLPGITRELIIEWGRDAGLPIREATLPFSVMNTTRHAALTSSLKAMVPVTHVGERALETGPLTRQLADLFRQRRAVDFDP